MKEHKLDYYQKEVEKQNILDVVQCICDFACSSDYEFYKEIQKESTKEEFEDFCKEFPEARIVLEVEVSQA